MINRVLRGFHARNRVKLKRQLLQQQREREELHALVEKRFRQYNAWRIYRSCRVFHLRRRAERERLRFTAALQIQCAVRIAIAKQRFAAARERFIYVSRRALRIQTAWRRHYAVRRVSEIVSRLGH